MKDGLYGVHFRTPIGEGNGVVALLDGKVRGGDDGLYYIGTFISDGDKLTAEITIDRYAVTLANVSVFGIDRAHITLQGQSDDTSAHVTGRAKEAPNVTFQATLTRLAD